MAWIASLKIVLISTGIVALVLAMKLSVPMAIEFMASYVPVMCSSFRSLLRPPYLYVLINGIIITIVASSRFQHDRSPRAKVQLEQDSSVSVVAPPVVVYEQRDPEPVIEAMAAVVINRSVEAEPEPEPEPEPKPEPELPEVEDDCDYEDKLVVSTWTPPKSAINSDEIALPAEKPLVTARIGQRKPARSSAEAGRPLRVSKPKRNDTLENTWKAIMEGRSMPLSRHMKKCETLENHSREMNAADSAVDTSAMEKSETFKDRTPQRTAVAVSSSIGTGGGKLRKEPSLSQDELNRRAEAFINKFNEEMRIQRQESLNQYMEMINR